MRNTDVTSETINWTARQREVLGLLAAGKTNPEIATALGLSLDGAKWHVSEVMSKLGVHSREAAGEYWRRHESLPARLRRGVSGFVSGGVLKYGAVGAILVVVTAVTVVVLVAGGDPDPGASQLPTPGTSSTARPSQVATASATSSAVPATTIPSLVPAPTGAYPAGVSPVFDNGDGRALYPAGTRTGEPAIDRLIRLVEAKDIDGLMALVSWEGSPCYAKPFPSGGTLLCPEGVPEGTLFPAFFAAHIEGGPITDPAAVRDWIERMVDRSAFLFGAYKQDGAPGTGQRTVVQFAQSLRDGAAPGFQLDANGGFVAGFFEPIGVHTYASNAGRWLFPPPDVVVHAGESLHPRGTRTGDAAVDRIIAMVEDQDTTRLYADSRWRPIPCTTVAQPTPNQVPCEGDPQGTIYPAFRVIGGEGGWLTSETTGRQLMENAVRLSPFLAGVYEADVDGEPITFVHFELSASGEIPGASFGLNARGEFVVVSWSGWPDIKRSPANDWIFPPPR